MSQNSDGGALLKRLFRETFRVHLVSYVVAVLAMMLVAGSTAGLAWPMQSAINKVFVEQNSTAMWMVATSIMVLAVIKGLSDYTQNVLMSRINNGISAQLQQRMFDKMLSLKMEYFKGNHSSIMINGISNFAKGASGAVTLIVTTFGRDLLTLVALGTVMFVQDPILSLGAIGAGPIIIFGVNRLIKRVKAISTAELKGMAQIVSLTQEAFHGIREVKSFTAEQSMRTSFGEAASELAARMNKISQIKATTSPLMETMGGITIALMVLYAGWQTISAGKTPGEFMSFVTAFLLAYEPAKRLANMRVSLQQNLIAITHMYEFLDTDAYERDEQWAVDTKISGQISFENVHFSYVPGVPVLKDVNFSIEKGEIAAFVGRSGSGKSTIFSLIERFYVPSSGRIAMGDTDSANLRLQCLRGQISAVGQSSLLFSGSIRENILMGRTTASFAEVEKAAEAARALDFIRSLPNGFDTNIGERGLSLSGGQAQRVAIARAFLKDAPILLLDEATSALDTETEKELRESLRLLMMGRTTLVIAHRLSTIFQADKIFVIDGGRVIDTGSHKQLLQRSELYQRLFGEFKDDAAELAEPA